MNQPSEIIAGDDKTTLAAHPCCTVEQCDCGEVLLTVGAVTLRLQRDAFLLIADVCGSAARVAAVQQLTPPPRDRSAA